MKKELIWPIKFLFRLAQKIESKQTLSKAQIKNAIICIRSVAEYLKNIGD